MVYMQFFSLLCASLTKASLYKCEDACLDNYINCRNLCWGMWYILIWGLCMYSRRTLCAHRSVPYLLEVIMATLVHCGIVFLLICGCSVLFCGCICLPVSLCLPRYHAVQAVFQLYFSHLWKLSVALTFSLSLDSVMYMMKNSRKMISLLQ
jgi:hypothetical protein